MMKLILTLLLSGWAGVTMGAERTEFYLQKPVRIMNGTKVDLKPLCDWWVTEGQKNPAPKTRKSKAPPVEVKPRPLSAWVHITGTAPDVRALGWVMTVEIEERPGKRETAKIFLRHPPAQEKQRFEALTAELKDVRQYREHASNVESGQQSVARDIGAQANTLNTVRFADPGLNRRLQPQALEYSRQAGVAYDRSRVAGLNREGAERRMGEISEQLRAMPPGEVYRLDYLAMKTGEVYAGLPVYDLGLIY